MMYPFMTLDDQTEIVHSEMRDDQRVKVYLEKPDEKDCFHHATCYLPDYEWTDIFGFSPAEIARYQEIIESTGVYQIIREGRIPFELFSNSPTQETVAAMLEAKRIAKAPSVKGYTNLQELFADMRK